MPGFAFVMPGFAFVMPGLTGHLHNNVNVFVRPAQEAVPDVAANHEGPDAQLFGRIPHQLKHRMV